MRYFLIFINLFLASNKIKLLNGDAFKRLHKLDKIFLQLNSCIDEHFLSSDRIAIAAQLVTASCGYDETKTIFQPDEVCKTSDIQNEFESKTKCIAENIELRSTLEFKIQEIQELTKNLHQREVEVNDKKEEIAKLKKKIAQFVMF